MKQICENCGEVFFQEWASMVWCVTCETYESCQYEHDKNYGEIY